MSKRAWGNGFASGLIAGICGVLVLLSAARPTPIDPAVDHNGRTQGASSAADAHGDEQSHEPQWLNWSRRLVAVEDTLAQWIMALFTMVAVLIVWRTLVETQNMVRDTRRIGEAQVRAYISILGVEGVFVRINEQGLIDWRAVIMVKNSGHSPARNVTINLENPPEGIIPTFLNIGDLGAGDERQVELPAGGASSDKVTGDGDFVLAVDLAVTSEDVFGRSEKVKVGYTGRLNIYESGKFVRLRRSNTAKAVLSLPLKQA